LFDKNNIPSDWGQIPLFPKKKSSENVKVTGNGKREICANGRRKKKEWNKS